LVSAPGVRLLAVDLELGLDGDVHDDGVPLAKRKNAVGVAIGQKAFEGTFARDNDVVEGRQVEGQDGPEKLNEFGDRVGDQVGEKFVKKRWHGGGP
jgi:hypothetical protein